jgi:hypothetical protein
MKFYIAGEAIETEQEKRIVSYRMVLFISGFSCITGKGAVMEVTHISYSEKGASAKETMFSKAVW